MTRASRVGDRPGADREDHGSGTILVLGLVMVVMALVGWLGAVGAAVVARHRAETVADLAALAAASNPERPDADGMFHPSGCAGAVPVARAGGASLLVCRSLPDGSVIVEVAVPVVARTRPTTEVTTDVTDAGWRAMGRARAGPAP